ncbi:hypothetical protein F4818DRAFT_457863 [Hypoxylon cercidicola]|nr:hypothetical protein F4818DRAFT_457863 [Hypoxylon cercidicola]
MPSRHPQPRQHGGEIMASHRPVRSQNESTLAYDPFCEQQSTLLPHSMPYQKVNRMLERVPEAGNKDTKWAKLFGNWLGKPKAKSSGNPEKIRISEPRLISPPSHLRHSRQSVEQTSVPKRVSRILPELPKPSPKASRIRRKDLGKTHEALGSHPVGSWLDRMNKQYPAQHILLRTAREESRYKNTIRGESSHSKPAPSHVRPLSVTAEQTPADIKAERRKGRIFLDSDLSRSLYEFPDPEEWYDDSDDDSYDSSDDSYWEDAGFDDVDDASVDGTIPDIIITEPDDNESNENTTQRNRASKSLLDVDDCYKLLWISQDKELKGLKRYLVPLAYLVAEAENIDLDNNIELLEDSLKHIIADRERLFELYPLAHMLAEDQKIDVEDFKALPQALENVFADRDNAKRLVRYHKTTKERLERRVAEMETERDYYHPDGEDYIRL